EPPRVTSREEHGCRIERRETRVVYRPRSFPIEVTADLLTCGALRLGDFDALLKEAMAVCQEMPSEAPVTESFSMERTVTVVARKDHLVSTDQGDAGFTGGAHPYGFGKRRTWDTRSGKMVTLADLRPRDHQKLLGK